MESEVPFTIDQFYKFLAENKLMAGKCTNCGKIHLPPRPLCDNCFSSEFTWVEIAGKGKLLTYTVIYIAPEQFQDMTPYAVGIIELQNGLKLPGMINTPMPEQLHIVMELCIYFTACSQAQPWPKWPRYCFKPI
jgi:uncharacterized OB-fold protein